MAIAALCAVCCGARVVDAGAGRTLFEIARSKNANKVCYDVRVGKDGALRRGDPVDAYWRLFAEDGRREDLGPFERRLAYGYSVDALRERSFTLRLTAFVARPIEVELAGGQYVATTGIAGHRARLSRIFVRTRESGIIPHVVSVELYGRDRTTGAAVHERLVPN